MTKCDFNKVAKQTNKKSLRSSTSVFNKETCIICQSSEGTLHKVTFESTVEKMLDATKKRVDHSLFLRLNTIPNTSDAIANDVQYLTCWVDIKRQAEPDSINIREIVDIERVLADIEIVNTVQTTFIDSTDKILDMNVLSNCYKSMLKERDRRNFKPYIKPLLQENIPDILFIRPPARNVLVRVCTKQLQIMSIQKSFENSWDSYKNIFNTAEMIRKDISAEKNWKFLEFFDGFDIPNSLKMLSN